PKNTNAGKGINNFDSNTLISCFCGEMNLIIYSPLLPVPQRTIPNSGFIQPESIGVFAKAVLSVAGDKHLYLEPFSD
ncbi:hypothetical protein, partial [Planktothrix sp.]|uniref:hypothetical protein n=1 Tax=Planktothrix sp. TaxID=3088171 RepID=UPI0038D48DD2